MLWLCSVKIKDLETFMEPIFVAYKNSRKPKEGFGDWTMRVGFPAVRQMAAAVAPTLVSMAPAMPGNGAAGNGNGTAAAGGRQLVTK